MRTIGRYGVLITNIGILNAHNVRAEMSPEYYARLQAESCLEATIRVLSVQRLATPSNGGVTYDVMATARVVDVIRSAVSLHPGKTIQIRYQTRRHKLATLGPAEVPVLKAGETYPAFLNRRIEGRDWEPAARSRGFSPRIESYREKST